MRPATSQMSSCGLAADFVVVGLLTDQYPSEPFFAGGLASYLQRLAEGLVRSGHRVEVFVSGTTPDHYELNGVRVNRVAFPDRWRRMAADRPFLWRAAGIASSAERGLIFERAVRSRCREQAFDVLQAPDYLAPGLVLALKGRLPLVTRVSHYGPLWDVGYGREATMARKQAYAAEKHVMRCSCAVYGPSAFLASRVSAATGVEVEVIPPPFDTHEIVSIAEGGQGPGELANTRYAMFFGTIGLLKGADRIVEVLPTVLGACPDMTFVFVGDISRGWDGRTFSELVSSELGEFQSRVRVLPALRHEELWPLVAGSRYVVLPSRFDNLPNACLEAMALGRPVIASMGASFEEIVAAGISGKLVPQDRPEALADAMIQYWRMPQPELDRLGRAGRAALQRLTSARTIPPLEALYTRVLSQHLDGRCPRHARGAFSLARELARLVLTTGAANEAVGSHA